MSIPNPELRLAEEFVLYTNCNIFLTGKAGTGKTTFLHTVQKATRKRLVVTAPTGAAAINAGGVTLHSFFQLPLGPFVPGGEAQLGQHRIRREKKNLIRSLDLLVIDEISMVRSDLLDGVDTVLRRYRRSDLPFGGVQLLMIGDLHQLPPVVRNDEWRILQDYYESPYFFSSTALCRTELIPIELKHIYRQSDPRFIDLLGRVRDGNLDPPTVEKLNSRYIPDFSPRDEEGYITLCTHNRSADRINEARLKSLPGKSRRFNAEVEGDFPEQAYPTSATLEIKVGAQVMFVRNDMSPERRYFNGKIGEVVRISNDEVQVRCPGETDRITVEKAIWENIEYAVDPETAEISQKIIGTFGQYPLKLAWAITIHKSQGLTFDRAIIDAQAAFAHGQVYVALSRCRSFEGMVLSTPLGPHVVKTDRIVRKFVADSSDAVTSQEKLEAEKSRYQQRLILDCFSFDGLKHAVGRLGGLLRVHSGVVQVPGPSHMGEVQARTVAEICTIGEKFKLQLQGMFTDGLKPADDPAVVERLTKASRYFGEKFDAILIPCVENAAVETDNKEVRKRINDAFTRLREETAVKLAGVRSCRNGFSPEEYLRSISAAGMEAGKAGPKPRTVVYSEADVGHPELFESLRSWRNRKAAEGGVPPYQILHQKTLVQIAVRLPDSLAALMEVRGIGPRLAGKYGEEIVEMVADYRRKHGIEEIMLPEPATPPPPDERESKPVVKQDTKKLSLELFDEGRSIPQIAAERGLAVSTIERHLVHFVANGELEIKRVLPDEKRLVIEKAIADSQGGSLKEVKTSLGDGYSYGEIKLVLAHLESSR